MGVAQLCVALAKSAGVVGILLQLLHIDYVCTMRGLVNCSLCCMVDDLFLGGHALLYAFMQALTKGRHNSLLHVVAA